MVSTRIDGTARPSRLRRDDLEHRFPGLLSSILTATPPRVPEEPAAPPR
ncbi:hypothetical protein [Microtetraspora malaysiensis]|nr:hypothetical protein [Microtetraspora malaysiensis]